MTRNPYTAWTTRLLEEDGWDVWKVERREVREAKDGTRTHRTFDLYGLADLFALRGLQAALVQSTGPNGHAEHRKKMLENPRLAALELVGFEVWLVSWTRPARGRAANPYPWKPRLERIMAPPELLEEHDRAARALAVELVQRPGTIIPFEGGVTPSVRARGALARTLRR